MRITTHNRSLKQIYVCSLSGKRRLTSQYTLTDLQQAEPLGAAMVTTVGDPADPVIIHTSKIRGAYEEQKAALLLALSWARANCPTECISIYSDSQALLKDIHSGAHSFRQRLDNRKGPTILIWAYQATRSSNSSLHNPFHT